MAANVPSKGLPEVIGTQTWIKLPSTFISQLLLANGSHILSSKPLKCHCFWHMIESLQTHVKECVVVDLLSEQDDSRRADGILALAVDGAVLLPPAVHDSGHRVALDADADAVPLAVRQVGAELEPVFGRVLLALVGEAHAAGDLQAQDFVSLGAETGKNVENGVKLIVKRFSRKQVFLILLHQPETGGSFSAKKDPTKKGHAYHKLASLTKT